MNLSKLFNKFNKLLVILTYIILSFSCFNKLIFAETNPFGMDVEINSDAVFLINQDTNKVIYEKEKNLQIPCSALCKIMTTILILESEECTKNRNKFLKKEITATPEIFERLYLKGASNADIKQGETIRVIDALYATMLQSACEATMMLVNLVSGNNIEDFVELMNKKAKELKMQNTYFTDPDGLNTKNQYTSAFDMYLLTKYCLKNELFKKISTSKTYEIPPTNIHKNPIKLTHTNKMLNRFLGGKNYDGRVKGIKTAKIEDKDSLITIAEENNYNYLLVTLGAPKIKNETTIFKETKQIYDWVFKNLKLEIVATPYEKTIPNNIKVNMGKNSDKIFLTPKEQVTILIPKSVDKNSIFWDTSNFPKEIDAPIKKGTFVGDAILKLSDQEIEKIPLVAAQDVNVKILPFLTKTITKILLSWWFITIAILTTTLIFTFLIKKKLTPKKRKFKKYRPFK